MLMKQGAKKKSHPYEIEDGAQMINLIQSKPKERKKENRHMVSKISHEEKLHYQVISFVRALV